MSESKQPVAPNGADAQAAPVAETPVSARDEGGDDLDKLLAEYASSEEGSQGGDAGKKPAAKPEEKPATKQGNDGELYGMVRDLVERERARDEERIHRQFEADMKETVKSVRGDIPADVVSDRLVRAWIDAAAEEDPRLAKAWVNRKKDPAAFTRIVGQLGKNFAKEFSKRPDPAVTEDRAIVANAVRNASGKAPEERPPAWSGMSDNDFAANVEKQFGFRPI